MDEDREDAVNHAELEAQGWKRQATYDDPRLSEMVEMYEELDFEVRLEPFQPLSDEACAVCMQQDPDRFKTIYTRQKDQEKT
jgi:hypothetical protein